MKSILKRVFSFVILVSLVFTSALGTTNARVTIKKPQVSLNEMGNFLAGKVSRDSDKSNLEKKETVYVELNGDGSTKEVTVSDILTGKGSEPITDVSNLKNIENLKGDETYTKKDGKLVWENKGKSITYQGSSDEEPPISVDISYALDGNDISAKDLEGKSGELQIQYKFKNNARIKGHDYIPFFVLGGFILDNETFSNVVIDNGKVADYDESKIVLGYAVPGLESHIKKVMKGAEGYLNKIDLSDEFTISADVKDFNMSMGLLVATSSLGDFNIKDAVDLSDIKNKMNQLQDGADALVNGVDQLSDGTSQLASGSEKIKNGTNKLSNGLKKISKGTKKLKKGNKKFHKGIKKGLKTAKSGTKKLADGSDKLAKGAKGVDDGAKKLDSGASSLDSGSKQVSSGASQIKNGFDKEGGLNDGAKAIKNGAQSANNGVKKVVGFIQNTPSSIDTQISGILAKVSQASGGAITTEAQLNAVIEGINSAVKGGTPLEDAVASKGLNVSTYYALAEAYYGIKTLNSVKATLSNQISEHSGEIKALTNGMNDLENGADALNGGVQTAYDGISALAKGASDLSNGASALKSGTTELSKGTGALKTGAETLNTGVGTLYDGVKVISKGINENSPKLVGGMNNVDKAIAKVCSGSLSLKKGMVPFCNGINKLNSGVTKLKSGATKLNEEGIKKITSVFGTKVDEMIDGVQELLDAGNSYKSFSGISKGMDGQVKFIYKTPEIGVEE